MNIQPLNRRVLISPLKEEVSKAGVILPESAQEEPQRGTVIATSTAKTSKVKVGDKVLFTKYGDKVKIDGEELFLIEEKELLALLK